MQLQAVFLPFVVAVLLHMQALYLQNGIHVGALYCGVLPFRRPFDVQLQSCVPNHCFDGKCGAPRLPPGKCGVSMLS